MRYVTRTCHLCGETTDQPWRHCLKCYESLPPLPVAECIKDYMKSCLLCGAKAESKAATCAHCGEGSWSVCVDEAKAHPDEPPHELVITEEALDAMAAIRAAKPSKNIISRGSNPQHKGKRR